MTITKDGTITGTTTPAITGQRREEQQKILQLAMQYLSDPWLTLKDPQYLYSQVGEPKPNTSFLKLPEQAWELFFQVNVPIYMFTSSERMSPEMQAAAGKMTTASVVVGIEIGLRSGIYSVERHFLSVDKNKVFDTPADSTIAEWHGTP